MKAITIRNLTFSYNKTSIILDDVSFDVEKGKYVSIMGHNGSGKSTLAKLLIGLLNAKKGEIEIFGLSLDKDNIKEIRKVTSIVFQNPDNQFVGATVEDDLAFGLENKCVPSEQMKDIILDYASKVNMASFLEKEPSQLSGGQKQRVALAGVLALSPKLLILDEATSMLDPKGKREIRELILSMKKKDKELTVLSITHDVEEAYLSDEVIVLSEGKVVKQGSPKEVFSNKEDILKLNLTLPFEIEIKDELKKIGISIKDSDDIESVVDTLCQLM